MSFNNELEGWSSVKLKDISVGNRGNYGIGASAVEYDESLYTYLRITDITDDGRLNKEGLMSVDDEDAKNYLLSEDDIVFARTGNSTGRSYFYEPSDGELVYAGFLIKFKLDRNKVNPRYIKLYTLTQQYRNWIDSFSTGSTRKNINAKMYGEMDIYIPPRKVQDNIVNIIEPLNNKIELNNKINKNLEEMAQAIFKQWFIDFEFPNEEGKPYKSSGGEMVESELGMIPKGWTIRNIKDITLSANTGADAIRRAPIVEYDTGIKCVRVGDFTNNRDLSNWGYCKITDEDYNKFKLTQNDILITRTASIGLTKFITVDINAVYNNGIIRLKVNDGNTAKYIYSLLRNKDFMDYINRITGETSTRPNMKVNYVLDYKFVLPSKEYIDKFCELYINILLKLNKISNENEKLAELRDALLPKLMSGEIRVKID